MDFAPLSPVYWCFINIKWQSSAQEPSEWAVDGEGVADARRRASSLALFEKKRVATLVEHRWLNTAS
jgi:hypothetical protein